MTGNSLFSMHSFPFQGADSHGADSDNAEAADGKQGEVKPRPPVDDEIAEDFPDDAAELEAVTGAETVKNIQNILLEQGSLEQEIDADAMFELK